MAGSTGLFSQIGFGEEITYGTRVAPTRFLEYRSEGLQYNIDYIKGKGLRAGQRLVRTDRTNQNKKGAAGPIELEIMTKGCGLLFKHIFGAAPTITTPMGATLARKHAYVIGDPKGLFLSTQVLRNDVGAANVGIMDYTGCKIVSAEFDQALNEDLILKLDVDAQDEKTGNTLATASYPTSQAEYHFGQCSVTVNSAAWFATKFNFKYEAGLDTGRYGLQASTLKKEPLAANILEGVSGQLDGEFDAMANYNLVRAGTVVPIVITWDTGVLIDGGTNYKLVLTIANALLKGDTPNVGGPGIVGQPLKFDVLDDGSTTPIELDYYTTDTAI